MIDLHCHILPGIDDGPAALADSLQMAAVAVADGIQAVVATPHSGNGVYSNSPADISAKVDAFREELTAASIPLQVYPGAELQLGRGLAARLLRSEAMPLNHSRYILLELPQTILPAPCKNEIFNLRAHGYIPLIAHPERHPYLQRHPGYLADLVRMGALCQVTAQSLLGHFGRSVRTTAETMLQSRLVHVLASDAHDPQGRAPVLAAAVAAAARLLGSGAAAEQMVTAIPSAVISDADIAVDLPDIQAEPGENPAMPGSFGSFISSISALWS